MDEVLLVEIETNTIFFVDAPALAASMLFQVA